MTTQRRGTALITGASSGLGEEFAWQLAVRHHDLVLVARREDRLRALQHRLEQAAAISVQVLPADLATAAGRAVVAERITHPTAAPVGLVVNNAGFGLGQRFVDGDLQRERDAIAVMITAVMELSHAAASAMIPRGRGAILNVSSMVADTAMGTYAAAKAWVKTFTEALAGELAGTGVSATAVSPGLVRTEFHAAAQMDDTAWPAIGWLTAEQVVTAALAAVRRGQIHVVPSLRYRALQSVLQHSPRPLVRTLGGPGLWERAITR
ncbi:MAG: SDR family NAD(P)-dependent oxidoreductase [Bowdeniella nasicola]|nr:SDR family NAD(P)-dependent oxidoreductase [Bowdeniella nasicola]